MDGPTAPVPTDAGPYRRVMSTTATLDSTTVSLDPGGEAVIPLQIRNNGDIVEGYRIQVVGVPAAWASVEPDTLSLYPGTATTATVTFRPPRSSRVPAGRQEFGVIVMPTENPEAAVVPEGVVEVLPFLETVAELVPRTSQGSRKGRHKVAVDNRGNVAVTAVLSASDDGRKLRFRTEPPALTVNPGEAQFADVKVRPAKKIWRGPPVTHPFVVEVAPQDSTPVTLDGSHVQTALIPKWLPKLLLGLLALAALLLALWFLVLKPTIESQAREAVEDDVAAAKENAAAAKEQAEQAQQSATGAKDAQGQTEKIAKSFDPKAPAKTETINLAETLNVTTLTSGSDSLPIGDRAIFRMTDLVFSNPQGDFGSAQIQINGETKFRVALENFRDLDYHFVTPVIADGGSEIELLVQCNQPGAPPEADPAEACDIQALVGGELVRPAPAE
jgi:hypothetical protein